MAMADITVMGAGIFGLSVAWACLKRGASVQVVEKDHAGAGSSGGIVGALAPHVPDTWDTKKAFQLESLLMAEAFWAEVAAVSGISPGYAQTGRLQPIGNERLLQQAYDRVPTSKEFWQGRAEWRIIDAAQAGAWAPQSGSGFLIFDTLAARINPRLATQSLAKAVEAKGATFITADARTVTPGGAVVWATGYQGLYELSDEFEKPAGNGVKGQSALLAFDARDRPQLFADAIHIVPHENGTVAIGSTSERYFDDPSSTDDQLDDVLARARTAFPVLENAAVLERWAGVRPRGKTRAPMLGHYPGRDGQYIANGGFKIGFGMAPMVGETMAELILNDVDRIPTLFKVEANL
ncbi:NAD(P)/FAD-dependent oxidoreductase [Cochlodiniinecator piscidefendens]|uniref:NAD(P)/FAD-dependent oxidoreductase n=1 Tax=Cochlodiniinecator piscidefendens TaxID=2715756 RepID=UPI00140CBEB9|nr:FAD-binding oxidoreductase [Cochlodiniinecator piscidefendens]